MQTGRVQGIEKVKNSKTDEYEYLTPKAIESTLTDLIRKNKGCISISKHAKAEIALDDGRM